MPDTPDVPDSNDPFGKQVALTIALLAVVLAVISNKGDSAKTDAIIKTNEASDQWGHYQAKSLKQNLSETEGRLLAILQTSADTTARTAAIAKTESDAKRYNTEKEELKVEAEKLVTAADHNSKINDRCDLASLGLQIGIVVCSVSILSKWRLFWFIGITLGVIGGAIGATAFLM